MSAPVADHGRRGEPDDGPVADVPPRARGATTDAQLTVDALLARSRAAGPAGRRRADRRAVPPAPPSRPSSSSPRPNTTTPPPPPRPSTPPPPSVPRAQPPAPRPPAAEAAAPAPVVPPTAGPGTSELSAAGLARPAEAPRAGASGSTASGAVAPSRPDTSALPAQGRTDAPRPTMPPVPASPVDRTGVRHSAPVPPLPGTERSGGRPSAPVPPLPGAERGGVRHSTPVPPLPGLRPATPVPPIPGLDLPSAPPPAPTRAERRAAMSPARRRLLRAAVALATLVVLVGGYYIGLYFVVDRGIDRVAALSPGAPEILAPQLQEGAQTYLVVGRGVPGEGGAGAVTALLARIAPDGGSAVLVDVPPTALVDIPECRAADGSVRAPSTGSFADALLQGSPSCLVRAAQQLSGLRVDHYVGVDLGRLPGMVDALDGVTVCVPGALPAADGGPALPAGTSRVAGDQVAPLLAGGAVAGDATGAAVAGREQLLLTSTLGAGLQLGTLVDPLTATRFLTRTGGALTVDEDTTLGDVRSFSGALRGLPADAVARTTLPVTRVGYVPAGTGTAQVLLDGTATRTLFDSVIADGVLPEPVQVPPADAAPAADPATGVSVTLPPTAVTVEVLDAGEPADPATGPGAAAGAALAAQGFVVRSVAVEPAPVTGTVVRYAPAAVEPARTLAAAIPGAVLQESPAAGDAVQLVVSGGVEVQPVAVGAAVPESALPVTDPETATCP